MNFTTGGGWIRYFWEDILKREWSLLGLPSLPGYTRPGASGSYCFCRRLPGLSGSHHGQDLDASEMIAVAVGQKGKIQEFRIEAGRLGPLPELPEVETVVHVIPKKNKCRSLFVSSFQEKK